MPESQSLHEATETGNVERIRAMLHAGADPNARDGNGATPLHWTAFRGQTDLCTLLLEKGAEVDAKASDGRTPLHLAALSGNTDALDLLASSGADYTIADTWEGWTPLHVAAAEGHHEAVNLLLALGADADARDLRGETALHQAARNGHGRAVHVLLALGADVNAVDGDGITPLYAAVVAEQTESAGVLLGMDAAPNLAESKSGLTPLHAAASAGNAELVRLLIENGADPTVTAQDGTTVEALAAGHADIIAQLQAPRPAPLETLEAGAPDDAQGAAFGIRELALPDEEAEEDLTEQEIEEALPPLGEPGSGATANTDTMTVPMEGVTSLRLAPSSYQEPEVETAAEPNRAEEAESWEEPPLVEEATAEGVDPAPEFEGAADSTPATPLAAAPVEAPTPKPAPTGPLFPQRAGAALLGLGATLTAITGKALRGTAGLVLGTLRSLWKAAIVGIAAGIALAVAPRMISRETPKPLPHEQSTATKAEADQPVEVHIPARTGDVNDFAGILDRETRRKIDARLRSVRRKTGVRIVLVTVATTRPLKTRAYAHELAKHWKLGFGADDRRLLLLLSVKDGRAAMLLGERTTTPLTHERLKASLRRDVIGVMRQGNARTAARKGIERIASLIERANRSAPGRLPPRRPARRASRRKARASTGTTNTRRGVMTATIDSKPRGAWVSIDHGARSGTTPWVVVLSPGRHHVEVRKPGYRSKSQTIYVGADSARFIVSLEPVLD